jgi:TRAP-type C4-dicarboxylate transport system substrate-binding protein
MSPFLKRSVAATALALSAIAGVRLLAAAPITIRLSTFAPSNSPWHVALLDMGAAWDKATEGRVKLVVYPSGTQGTETSVVKLMRPPASQLQAALLLQPGLAEIDDAANVLGMPFLLQSDEEMQAVMKKIAPILSKRFEAKGFHVVHWGSAGWVQMFSKKPIKSLADLKQSKLYTTEGDDRMVQWYKSNGFNPVPLNFNDIPAQLKLRTGMIDAAPSPPQGALLLQFFRDAPYMLQLRVAPLIGATVMTDKAWAAISPEDRAKMLDAAQTIEKKLMTDAPKIDADSVAAMKSRGLTVTDLDPKTAAEFHAAADQMLKSMRGNMIPADVFDLVVAERDAFRKSKGK